MVHWVHGSSLAQLFSLILPDRCPNKTWNIFKHWHTACKNGLQCFISRGCKLCLLTVSNSVFSECLKAHYSLCLVFSYNILLNNSLCKKLPHMTLVHLSRLQPANTKGREGGSSVGCGLLCVGSEPQHAGVLSGLGHAQNHIWFQGEGTRQVQREIFCCILCFTWMLFVLLLRYASLSHVLSLQLYIVRLVWLL